MEPTDEPRQPRARCGLGFSCALMMMQPGLEPHDCENYRTCGAAVAFPPVTEFVLLRRMEPLSNVGDLHTIRARELAEWHTNRTQAAVAMLMMRGAPQSLADFGLPGLLDDLARVAGELRSALQRVRGYVAPTGAVITSEQRGGKRRLRLVTAGRLFSGASGDERVRAIHLGSEQDGRAVQAREGIVRRNRLQAAARLVGEACRRLEEAHALIDGSSRAGSGEQDDGRRRAGDRGGEDRGDDAGDGTLDLDGGDGDRGESVLMLRGAHQRVTGSHLDRRLTQVEALATTLMLVWGASGLFLFRLLAIPVLSAQLFYMAIPDWDIPLLQWTGWSFLAHRSWLFHSVTRLKTWQSR